MRTASASNAFTRADQVVRIRNGGGANDSRAPSARRHRAGALDWRMRPRVGTNGMCRWLPRSRRIAEQSVVVELARAERRHAGRENRGSSVIRQVPMAATEALFPVNWQRSRSSSSSRERSDEVAMISADDRQFDALPAGQVEDGLALKVGEREPDSFVGESMDRLVRGSSFGQSPATSRGGRPQ